MPRRLPDRLPPCLRALPDRLRQAREDAGLSQEDLARALGYAGKQIVGHWERGIALPTLPALAKLGDLLAKDPRWLAFGAPKE